MSGRGLNLALTSNFPSSPNDEVVACIHATARSPRIAWVAPQASSKFFRFRSARSRFRALGLEHLDFVNASHRKDADTDPFTRCDVVYLTGGNPLRFRQALAESGLQHHLRRFTEGGGLVVAASGGMMQLTLSISLYRLLDGEVDEILRAKPQLEGLGFVACEVLPHFDRQGPAFLERVRQYSSAVAHDIIALADGAAMLCAPGRETRYVGSAVRYRSGVTTSLGTGGSGS